MQKRTEILENNTEPVIWAVKKEELKRNAVINFSTTTTIKILVEKLENLVSLQVVASELHYLTFVDLLEKVEVVRSGVLFQKLPKKAN